MITAVACEGLDRHWLGRVIDKQNLKELKKLSDKYRFHLGGEGGEFETLVINCPLFKKPSKLLKADTEWDDKTNSGVLRVLGFA
jgi:uncharacterized protein (TIGR00290 family)